LSSFLIPHILHFSLAFIILIIKLLATFHLPIFTKLIEFDEMFQLSSDIILFFANTKDELNHFGFHSCWKNFEFFLHQTHQNLNTNQKGNQK